MVPFGECAVPGSVTAGRPDAAADFVVRHNPVGTKEKKKKHKTLWCPLPLAPATLVGQDAALAVFCDGANVRRAYAPVACGGGVVVS